MKKLFLSLAYLCSIAIQPAFAQETNVVPLPADMAELFKYNSTPVSMYTGLPQISYPLYEVNTGKIRIPITLSYHASGIKVNQKATIVGLGWSLSAGGSIGRQIRGGKDEALPYGWFSNTFPLDTLAKLQWEPDVYSWYTGFNDLQPDFFDFNFTGRSGRFIWSRSQQTFVVSPYQPLRVQRIATDNTYEITDDDGTRYFFGQPVNTYTESSVGLKTDLVGWNLTKIISADASDTVLISYTIDPNTGERGELPISTFSRNFHFNVNLTNDVGGYVREEIQESKYYSTPSQYRIKEITFRQGKVVFFANTPRADYSGNAMDSVVVYSKDNGEYARVKKISFSYDYFFSGRSNPSFFDYRLKLKGFSKDDINGEQPETYQFDYNNKTLPYINSFAADWWGYYNGKTNQSSLMPAQSPNNLNLGPVQNAINLGPADRNSDSAFMFAGILNKVIYPTGGYTTYSYSPNKFVDDVTNAATDTLVNLTLKGKTSDRRTSSDSIITTFKVKAHGRSGNQFAADFTIVFSPHSNGGGERWVVFKDLATGIELNHWSSYNVPGVKMDTLTWTYPCDTGHVYQVRMYSEDLDTVFVKAFIKSDYVDLSKLNSGGCLHVDSIASYNLDNTLQSLEIYKYGENENGAGYMPTPLSDVKNNNYSTINTFRENGGGNFCTNIQYGISVTYNAQSSYPYVTFQGANVLYDVVTKYNYSGGKPNGKTVYQFDLPQPTDFVQIRNPLIPVNEEKIDNSFSDEQSQLRSESVYRSNDDGSYTLLKKTINDYSTFNVRSDSAMIIYKVGDAHFETGCATMPATAIFQFVPYYVKSGGRRRIATSEINYDDNGTVFSQTSIITYNDKLYPKTTTRLNSKNDTVVTKLYYPGEHASTDVNAAVLNKMVYRNSIRQPYWQGNYINSTLLNYKHTLFGDNWGTNDSLIAPKIDTAWQFGNDNSLPATTVAYQSYGKYGNIRQIRDDKGITSAYTWTADGTYPISQTAGAAINQVIYDGFEDVDTWTGVTRDAAQVHTGKYAGLINGAGSYTNGIWKNVALIDNTKFRYSGWVYSSSGSATISLLMKTANETAAYTYIDNVSASETGKWVYVEKEYTIPAGVAGICLRLTNNGSGKVWFDDVKLRPSASQMSTYTFNPLVGMSSKADEGNHTLYYEFDGLDRLKLIRNKDRNILKMYCYNYAGEIDKCEGIVYYNTYQSKNYTNSCASGPDTITYAVKAGTYTSLVSVADANSKALADIAANGQAYANKMIPCMYYVSHQMSDTFYRTTCGTSGTPRAYIYTIDEGAVISYISLADANAKAKLKLDSLGAVYANINGGCRWLNQQQSKTYQKACSAAGAEGTYFTYTVPANKYYSFKGLDSANYFALKELADSGQLVANRTGACYFYSDAQTATRNRQCDSGYIGSSVTMTVPARHDSSTVSKDAANLLAATYASQQIQNYANANGTCSKCNMLYTIKSGSGELGIFNVSIVNYTTGVSVYNKTFNGATAPDFSCAVIPSGAMYTVTIASSSGLLYATVNGQEKSIPAGSNQTWTMTPTFNIELSTKAGNSYSSKAIPVTSQKTNCAGDSTGASTYYTMPAGYYTSSLSQAYVDSLANASVNTLAQAYVNQYGYCMPSGKNFGIRLIRGGTDPGTYQLTVTNSSGTKVVNVSALISELPYYAAISGSSSYTVSLSFMGSSAQVEVNGTVYKPATGSILSFSITPGTLILVKKL